MATTLTLYLGHWPGPTCSRWAIAAATCSAARKLTQISRDQTMAQELIDGGRPCGWADTAGTRRRHTLSSSIGGRQTAPVVTRFELHLGHGGAAVQ